VHVAATDTVQAARLAAGAVAACAVVALVDPNQPGRYPSCPTAALLGVDCPACGTLRGVHALTQGRIGDALDHNLLLALAVPLAAVVWWRWLRAAMGRPARGFRWPSWATIMVIGVAATFAVLRNVPISALQWLDAAA
jgi:hypothetical protein